MPEHSLFVPSVLLNSQANWTHSFIHKRQIGQLSQPFIRRRPRQPASITAAQSYPAPVLSPTTTPSEGTLSSPIVHQYFSDEGPHYVMWYTTRAAEWDNRENTPKGTWSGVISLALSDDGLSWRRVKGPRDDESVLGPNDEQWWAFDTAHLTCGSVVLSSESRVKADAGVYFLYYSGGDSERVTIGKEVIPGARTRIGFAISKDGEHFSRIEGEFPSGAVLDVGPPGAFDDLFVANPSVLQCDDAPPSSRFVMFYHGACASSAEFAIGRAVSADGIAFTRSSAAPVVSSQSAPAASEWAARGTCRPCVVRRGKEFVMLVEVVDAQRVHRIAMCTSMDGVVWSELTVVLDIGEEGGWDAAGVSHPSAVVMDDDCLRLYYAGKRADHDIDVGRGASIGVAQSDASDWKTLNRLNGGATLT